MVANITVGQAVSISFIQDSLNKYIVSPANAFGLGGFVFDIEGETTINLDTEITDHYVENNYNIQDHIAIKPQRITLHNYVGELVYRLDKATNTPVQNLVQKLTVVTDYLPKLAAGAELFRQNFNSANVFEVAKNITNFTSTNQPNSQGIVDMWAAIKNIIPPTSRQQQAYMYFKALQEQKILVGLQTPFEFITNLAIERIQATQGEDSNSISEFTITLKKIRTVSFKTVQAIPADYEKFQERAAEQNQSVTNQGNTQGTVATLPSTSIGIEQLLGISKNAPN